VAQLKPLPGVADTNSTVHPGLFSGQRKGGKAMSAVTHDVIPKRKPRKKRRKGEAALRSLRRALARRKLEQMREEEILHEQIYDVFEDDTTSKA
jgi:hypothetical protein